MISLLRRVKSLHPDHKANGAAVAIAILTVLFLNLECQPRPAGADTIRAASRTAPVAMARQSPLPVAADDESLTPEQLAERMLKQKVELIEKGVEFLKGMPDYTALFAKRELVDGVMLDEQTISIKVRHQPFSVYMKWNDYDVGREVLYVDGINNGNMLVHAGGWKARLPALLMSPDSTLALKESRHPVTKAGLLALANTILEYNREDLKTKNYSSCVQLEDQMFGDRPCVNFLLEYRDRTCSREYRKSSTLIDKEWGVPVYIKNFGWPSDESTASGEELDEATLIEQYSYSDVKFRSSLASLDFEDTNADYRFKRQ